MTEAKLIAEIATPFLDDRAPPRVIGLFEGMDAPKPAASPGNR